MLRLKIFSALLAVADFDTGIGWQLYFLVLNPDFLGTLGQFFS